MEPAGRAEVDALEATRRAIVEPVVRAGASVADVPTVVGATARLKQLEGAELPIGAEVGRYKITGRIGAGGMGVVYRAHDPQLDREVALKLLLGGDDGTDGRTRLLREAKAAAKIHHPNVVTVYDAGEVDGRVFIAMEMIDGVTLKAWLRERGRPGGAMPSTSWRDVLKVMLSAGEGLAAAHAVGLVHRDFKPDNVLVDTYGRAHVLDFGLARPALEVAQTGAEDPTLPQQPVREGLLQTLTQTGMTVGTPAYMAPEQHLARPTSARSDQFSFCVATYEALYGQRPFAGDSYAELSLAVIGGRVTPPPRSTPVPARVWQALRRGLLPEPEARFPALAQLLDELAAALRVGTSGARAAIVAAALSLPALAVAGTMVLQPDGEDDRKDAQKVVSARTPLDPRSQDAARPPPTATPPAAASEPGVALARVSDVDPAELAALLGPVLPERAARLEVRPEGLVLVGPGAKLWKEKIDELALAIDVPRRAIGELGHVETPDEKDWAAFEIGTEGFERRAATIREIDDVEEVLRAPALGVVLVRAPFAAQQAVARWLKKKPDAPAHFKEWCFNNTSKRGGTIECWPTKSECEREREGWLGADISPSESPCNGKP